MININTVKIFIIGLVFGLIFKDSAGAAIILGMKFVEWFLVFGIALITILTILLIVVGADQVMTYVELEEFREGLGEAIKAWFKLLIQIIFVIFLINSLEASGFTNENILLFVLFWGYQFYLKGNNKKEDSK